MHIKPEIKSVYITFLEQKKMHRNLFKHLSFFLEQWAHGLAVMTAPLQAKA